MSILYILPFLGTVMAVTAVPVSIKALMDLGKLVTTLMTPPALKFALQQD